MSQRWSEYARVAYDQYETPEWVTKAVAPYLPFNVTVLEPACGSRRMVNALLDAGCSDVVGTDIQTGDDFLLRPHANGFGSIVTNPPFNLANQFIEHALELMKPQRGMVAMLLRTDFDHAKTRRHLFDEHPAFSTKLVLTKRIVWFERPGAAPSFNHAWFIWDWQHQGTPTLAWHFQ